MRGRASQLSTIIHSVVETEKSKQKNSVFLSILKLKIKQQKKFFEPQFWRETYNSFFENHDNFFWQKKSVAIR